MKKLLVILILILAPSAYSQNTVPISQIQGDGYFSPYADKYVTVEGIVTATAKRGFYIQTPDNEIDSNPKTSEGIYIYTKSKPTEDILRGTLVKVDGKVVEYRSKREVYSLFLTQIDQPKVEVISQENPIPKAIKLTMADFDPKGQIDQLERYEGMFVLIDDMRVVAPTTGFYSSKEEKVISDGVFWGVLAGAERPFREPGLELLQVIIDKLPQNLAVFDMNPERLKVDSNGLNGGRTINVTSGALVHAISGVISYSAGNYVLLSDDRPIISNNRTYVKASPAKEGQITVASMNLENLFDDKDNSDTRGDETILTTTEFQKKLTKISLAVRKVVSLPDVIGVVEVENIEALQNLADRVNEDVEKDGMPNPLYKPYLKNGNDFRGINVGFLIKESKLEVLEIKQIAKDLKFDFPTAFKDEMLYDRPPLLANVRLRTGDKNNAFQFSVIVNHFKSYRGIDQPRVQHKKRLQAEHLAKIVNERQGVDPLEKMVLIGDFNAFQFPDGYNDQIGTLLGKPSKDVIAPAEAVYNTGLTDLIFFIKKENRYSYIYGGNAQVLDHVLINKQMQQFAASFGYARVNADFPKVYANDVKRPERYSDHDVPVFYINTRVAKNDLVNSESMARGKN